MAAAATKVIIANRTAMKAKYGAAGWGKVRTALRGMVAADKQRLLTTTVLVLDSAADMHKVGATALTDRRDAAGTKARVDAIFTKLAPDYVMLLGAPDVIAQPELDNPLWTGDPNDDPDPIVPSDLPYSCEGVLVRTAASYKGPTRVVSRIPDLLGATDPAYVIGLIHNASRWKSLTAPRPLAVLAISTLTWRLSTQTSIAAIGGAAGAVHTCPTEGPLWSKAQLKVPMMFVNCHGGEFDPVWYGEKFAGQQNIPHAIDASSLTAKVNPGMVIAAECCYGTMHWNPSAANGQPGVAATLLREGAVGVFGASTVAYGPAVGNDNADIITRMFLETVTAGGSLGRSALAARQRFVGHQATLDPTNLKTLAQFDLLGDPSVHPIEAVNTGVAVPHALMRTSRGGVGIPAGVAARRSALASVGRALEASVPTTRAEPRLRAGLSRERLGELTGADTSTVRIRTFDTDGPAATAVAFHVAYLGAADRRSIVVVRTEPGQPPVVSRMERK